MAEGLEDPGGGLRGAVEELEGMLRERPYVTLALALAVGYVAGGGLFSPWTRPVVRAVLGALLVPSFRERVAGFAGGFRPGAATTGA